MPFRAFGDSDSPETKTAGIAGVEFQCPFGHSGILTPATQPANSRYPNPFQCPFGHSGILTDLDLAVFGWMGAGFNALSGIRGF